MFNWRRAVRREGKMRHSGLRRCFMLCPIALVLMSCDIDWGTAEPDPPSIMTKSNKLRYSTRTRATISSYQKLLENRPATYRNNLWPERFQVDRGQSFDDIIRHYQAAFDQLGGWEDLLRFDDSDFAQAAAWVNGEKIFTVFTVTPALEGDPRPVNTLSNLKCAPSASHCER